MYNLHFAPMIERSWRLPSNQTNSPRRSSAGSTASGCISASPSSANYALPMANTYISPTYRQSEMPVNIVLPSAGPINQNQIPAAGSYGNVSSASSLVPTNARSASPSVLGQPPTAWQANGNRINSTTQSTHACQLLTLGTNTRAGATT